MTPKIIISLITTLLLISCYSPKLMSYKEFSSIEEMNLPKILNLKSESKHLTYFGAYHSNNHNDTLFLILKKRFEEFSPSFVFHEGGSNWPIYKALDSTILVSGESGFTIQTCQEEGIEYGSIEPKEENEYAHLLEKHDLEWVVLMYMCRQIDQQQRFAKSHNTTDTEFLQNMDYFFRMLATKGIPLTKNQQTFNYWSKVYERLLFKPLDWRHFNSAEYYPNYYLTKMNDINRSSDEFRNAHMVEAILEKLEYHNKVLVVVGGGHLYIQESLLKYKFNCKFNKN